MQKVIYICDKCGKEADCTQLDMGDWQRDLCDGCMRKAAAYLLPWIDKGPEKAPRKKIDVGKLWALHDAKWTSAKIADELGVSTVTVNNYLKMPRPAKEENYELEPDED